MRISDWSSDVCSSDLRPSAETMNWSVRLRSTDAKADRNSARADVISAIGMTPSSITAIVLATGFGPSGVLVMISPRSEEHTSEIQSLIRISYAVFCLKKQNTNTTNYD